MCDAPRVPLLRDNMETIFGLYNNVRRPADEISAVLFSDKSGSNSPQGEGKTCLARASLELRILLGGTCDCRRLPWLHSRVP